MKLALISVRDIRANVFGAPYCVAALGAAVRDFSDHINREEPNNVMNRHPGDFELYHLGYYYDAEAKFEIFNDGPKQLAVGSNLTTTR